MISRGDHTLVGISRGDHTLAAGIPRGDHILAAGIPRGDYTLSGISRGDHTLAAGIPRGDYTLTDNFILKIIHLLPILDIDIKSSRLTMLHTKVPTSEGSKSSDL